jgi:hypothetical protein
VTYNIYGSKKLVSLGQDAVSMLGEEVVTKGILDEFANVLTNLDNPATNSDMVLSKEFDIPNDTHYMLFHLVTLGAAFLKIECHEYVVRKKFFRGYDEDIYNSMFFIEGLGNGLQQFRLMACLETSIFRSMPAPQTPRLREEIRRFHPKSLSNGATLWTRSTGSSGRSTAS